MSLNELCGRCGTEPAVRLLGTVAHCQPCADAFLDPIREKVRLRYGEVISVGRTDYGGWWLECQVCQASWVGAQHDPCLWCMERYQRVVEDERASLLSPSWLNSSDGNPTYDSLSDADKEVWDRTRGQTRGADSLKVWKQRLARAVVSGLISDSEARRAIDTHEP